MDRPYRIGVINWDNSQPMNTYFGTHASRVESQPKYRARVPYYADLAADGTVSFHLKTQEEFDRELSYAISAGIDYFAYAWYTEDHLTDTEENIAKGSVEPFLWELNHARHLHAQSTLRDKIGMCAVLICPHIYSESDFAKLADAMKQPYYETVDGRPLVCLFGGYRMDFINRLRRFPADFGTADPYIVFHDSGVLSENGDYSLVDGVCDYACPSTRSKDYAALIDRDLWTNENRKQYGVKILPHFTMGWDPSPRIDSPVPWCGYPAADYAPQASEEEFLAGGRRFAEWIRANKDAVVTDRIHVFAWNEFEEGGYICPNLCADGSVDEGHLRAFAKIVCDWQKNL